jgi:hypothetical protein
LGSKHLVSGGHDNHVKVWQVGRNAPVLLIPVQSVTTVAFSPTAAALRSAMTVGG